MQKSLHNVVKYLAEKGLHKEAKSIVKLNNLYSKASETTHFMGSEDLSEEKDAVLKDITDLVMNHKGLNSLTYSDKLDVLSELIERVKKEIMDTETTSAIESGELADLYPDSQEE